MAKLKKGVKLICIPCGRQVVISSAGVSATTLWCCGRPMKPGSKIKQTKSKAKKKK